MPKKDFMEHYTPIQNPIHPENEDKFETYGEDLEYVKNYNQNHVWTVVDGDDDKLWVLRGMHFVNRVYYLITKESHKGDDDFDEYDY